MQIGHVTGAQEERERESSECEKSTGTFFHPQRNIPLCTVPGSTEYCTVLFVPGLGILGYSTRYPGTQYCTHKYTVPV